MHSDGQFYLQLPLVDNPVQILFVRVLKGPLCTAENKLYVKEWEGKKV